jgi:hypothetical protein
VDVQHASTATELVVAAAKVDGSNTHLAERRSTHDTWLDGDVEVAGLQDRGVLLLEKLLEGDEFGMASSLWKYR